MKQIRIANGVMLSFLAIATVCIAGLFGSTIVNAMVLFVQAPAVHQLLGVISTCVLGGAVSGMTRRLPNYGGRPPVDSLHQHLKAPALIALLAVVLLAGIALQLRFTPEMSELSRWALNASIGLNLGIFATCLWTAASLCHQYRETCAWEDAVHPLHRGC